MKRRRILGMLITAVVVSATTLAQQQPRTGYLLGSIGFIDKSEGFIPSPGLSINLISKGRKDVIVSDENGDFPFLELLVGKYCLSSIRDNLGHNFNVKSEQPKCFDIKKKRTTRFDIIILKN